MRPRDPKRSPSWRGSSQRTWWMPPRGRFANSPTSARPTSARCAKRRSRRPRRRAPCSSRETPAEALAVLGAFPAPALVADALDTLRQAAAEIDAARKSVATGAAPARQAALARLAGWEPFDLVERALTELRGLDEERTAEDARVEALRIASAAERTVNDARAAFLRGEYESAIRALEGFEVPHLVDGTLCRARSGASGHRTRPPRCHWGR